MAIPTRRLGRTGHQSSVAILGAAAFARSNEAETEAAFTEAIERGVNHLDIAPSYGDAERLVGPLVPAVRDRLFVGCKTHRKNGDGVRAQLENSLTLLGCDQFDLYLMHGVTSLEDLDQRADAAAAIVRARDEGLCRFIRITGHDLVAPRAHAEAVRRDDLDTVMFPVNPRLWADDDYRADAEALLELCGERNVGVMAIKAAAARPWNSSEPRERRPASTWYEPYTTADEVTRGVRFALSTEGVHGFCTPGDVNVLRTALDAADELTPMDPAARRAETDQVRSEPLIFPMAAAIS